MSRRSLTSCGSVGGKGRKSNLISESGSTSLPGESISSRQNLVGVGMSREWGFGVGYGRRRETLTSCVLVGR